MVTSKKRLLSAILILGSAFLLVFPNRFLVPCFAAIQWSDDFDDGNHDGWSIFGVNITGSHYDRVPGGAFTVEDESLRANSSNVHANNARHPSEIGYGTWCCDLHVVENSLDELGVAFMIYDTNTSDAVLGQGYTIVVNTPNVLTGTIEVVFVRLDDPFIEILETYDISQGEGWYNLNITRDLAGTFRVYWNQSQIIQVVDTTYWLSNFFQFWAPGESMGLAAPAMDNVVVSGEEPFQLPPLPLELIILIVTIIVIIVVITVVFFYRIRKQN